MDERFKVAEALICSFIFRGNGIIAPDDRYSTRLCVIDEAKEIVVDVKHKLQYNYIKTGSSLYIQTQVINYIKNDKRAAVYACTTSLFSISDKKLLKNIKEIIMNLEMGKMYPNGNSVLSNEEYLQKIEEEKINNKVKKKRKKLK